MASILVCCGEALAVAGWLVAVLAAAGVGQAPAVDPRRPVVIWRVPGEGRGTAAVHGSSVFFLSKRHEIVAVDVATGRVRWRRSTQGPGAATAGSTVVVTPSVVVAGDDDLVAFDHSGVERWRFIPHDGYGAGIYLGAASADVVFAGSSSGHLYAVDATDGRQRWSIPLGTDGKTTVFAPVAAGSTVFAGFTSFQGSANGGLVAVDAESGRLRWRRALPGGRRTGAGAGIAGGPLPVDDLVLAGNRDGTIHAFDQQTGAVRWSLPSVARGAPGQSGDEHDYRALARTGRLLFAGSLTGAVTAYDLDTRHERWRRAPMDASVSFGIVSDERTVYVPYFSGYLVALRAADGEVRWRTGDATRGFSWMPLVADGRIFAAASAAGFFAFER